MLTSFFALVCLAYQIRTFAGEKNLHDHHCRICSNCDKVISEKIDHLSEDERKVLFPKKKRSPKPPPPPDNLLASLLVARNEVAKEFDDQEPELLIPLAFLDAVVSNLSRWKIIIDQDYQRHFEHIFSAIFPNQDDASEEANLDSDEDD